VLDAWDVTFVNNHDQSQVIMFCEANSNVDKLIVYEKYVGLVDRHEN